MKRTRKASREFPRPPDVNTTKSTLQPRPFIPCTGRRTQAERKLSLQKSPCYPLLFCVRADPGVHFPSDSIACTTRNKTVTPACREIYGSGLLWLVQSWQASWVIQSTSRINYIEWTNKRGSMKQDRKAGYLCPRSKAGRLKAIFCGTLNGAIISIGLAVFCLTQSNLVRPGAASDLALRPLL